MPRTKWQARDLYRFPPLVRWWGDQPQPSLSLFASVMGLDTASGIDLDERTKGQTCATHEKYRAAIIARIAAARPRPFGPALAELLCSFDVDFEFRQEDLGEIWQIWFRYHVQTHRDLTCDEKFRVHRLAYDVLPAGTAMEFAFNDADPEPRLPANVLDPELFA